MKQRRVRCIDLTVYIQYYSPSNEQLRLDNIFNKAFSTEMGLDMVHYTTEKNPPPQIPPLQHAIFVQIQNSRHYTGVNVQMDLVLEVSDLGMWFKCRFKLI